MTIHVIMRSLNRAVLYRVAHSFLFVFFSVNNETLTKFVRLKRDLYITSAMRYRFNDKYLKSCQSAIKPLITNERNLQPLQQ